MVGHSAIAFSDRSTSYISSHFRINIASLSRKVFDCTGPSCTPTVDFSGLKIDSITNNVTGTLISNWTGNGGAPNKLTEVFTSSTTNFTWERDKNFGTGFQFSRVAPGHIR